jgi:hypothetical protein
MTGLSDVAELIQDPALVRTSRMPVPLVDGVHVLLLGLAIHDVLSSGDTLNFPVF